MVSLPLRFLFHTTFPADSGTRLEHISHLPPPSPPTPTSGMKIPSTSDVSFFTIYRAHGVLFSEQPCFPSQLQS